MKTFGITFLILECLVILAVAFMMVATKPTFGHHKNRIVDNWHEGAHILLLFGSVLAFAVSIGLTKMILMFNFLESN
jgi:hypothetical protein